MSMLVFSPHLDDAVFSCGEYIWRHPETAVVTVFAAAPADFSELTAWDAASGFQSAQQAIAQRQVEDCEALALLAAQPTWLDFFDSQYRATPSCAELQTCLESILRTRDANTVLLPAGLFHSDHVLLHQVLIAMYRQHPDRTWLMYEEALYRRIPGLLHRRLLALANSGVRATPVDLAHDARSQLAKHQALACYVTQLHALAKAANGYADVFMPERYWKLEAIEPPSESVP